MFWNNKSKEIKYLLTIQFSNSQATFNIKDEKMKDEILLIMQEWRDLSFRCNYRNGNFIANMEHALWVKLEEQ